MSDTQKEVKITYRLKDLVTTGLGQIERGATRAGGALGGMAGALKNIGTMAAAGGLAAVVSGLSFIVREGEAANLSMVRLKYALKNVGADVAVNTKLIAEYASELQYLTGVADEDYIDAVTSFVRLTGQTGPILRDVLEAAANLAAEGSRFTDVSSAMDSIGKAMIGTRSALTLLGITTHGVTTPAERLNMILQKIPDFAGGAAEALAEGAPLSLALKRLKNTASDAAEEGFAKLNKMFVGLQVIGAHLKSLNQKVAPGGFAFEVAKIRGVSMAGSVATGRSGGVVNVAKPKSLRSATGGGSGGGNSSSAAAEIFGPGDEATRIDFLRYQIDMTEKAAEAAKKAADDQAKAYEDMVTRQVDALLSRAEIEDNILHAGANAALDLYKNVMLKEVDAYAAKLGAEAVGEMFVNPIGAALKAAGAGAMVAAARAALEPIKLARGGYFEVARPTVIGQSGGRPIVAGERGREGVTVGPVGRGSGDIVINVDGEKLARLTDKARAKMGRRGLS